MPIAGDYFVTPHAVKMFQCRVKRLSYNEALVTIVQGLAGRPMRLLPSGCAWIRVRRPYGFRAIIDDRQHSVEQPRPAVVTILKG